MCINKNKLRGYPLHPLKRAFEKYKPRGLFSEFYAIQSFTKMTKGLVSILKLYHL